jgi:hypothetical protein
MNTFLKCMSLQPFGHRMSLEVRIGRRWRMRQRGKLYESLLKFQELPAGFRHALILGCQAGLRRIINRAKPRGVADSLGINNSNGAPGGC